MTKFGFLKSMMTLVMDVIMENLREYVASKDSNLLWFLRRRFKVPTWKVDSYLTGGPG